MPLPTVTQPDFSAGAAPDVDPRLIDPRGFLAGKNTLLDNDGNAYKRGGSVALTSAFNASLRSLWEGFLNPGRRTLVAAPGHFGVVGSSGASITDLGPPGLSAPRRAHQIGDLLFLDGGSIYGGSRKGADYSTGTVTATHGFAELVGSGTSWTANVDPGMLFRIGTERVYLVETVIDNTHLRLTDAYEGTTTAGISYSLKRIETASGPYPAAPFYATAAGRLWAATPQGPVRFSSIDPDTGHSLPHTFAANDYHDMPDGAERLGMEALLDRLLVFTTVGLYEITGIAFNLIDGLGNPQQSLSLASGDLILWGNAGIARFDDALVAPCLDGVYLIDGRSPPVYVSRGIARTYRRYVERGYKPGGAYVHRNHYFLPILSAVNKWVDTLVCRLDRPVRTRSETLWPWTQMADAGGECSAFMRRASTDEQGARLLGASITDGKLLDLTGFFEPTAANADDHDGDAAEFSLTTRDYPTSDGGIGRVRRIEVLYEMEAATGSPQLLCDVGAVPGTDTNDEWDDPTSDWDVAQFADEDEFGEFEQLVLPKPGYGPDPGINKAVWMVSHRAPFVRFRLRCSDPVAKLTIHAIEVGVIPSGGNRLSRTNASP